MALFEWKATKHPPRDPERTPTAAPRPGDPAPDSCRRSRTQASAAVPRRASQLPRKPPWLRAPRCSAGSTAPDAATTLPESPPAVPARLLPAAARKVGENSTCGAQLGQQELTGPKSLRWTRKRAKWGALPSSLEGQGPGLCPCDRAVAGAHQPACTLPTAREGSRMWGKLQGRHIPL